MSRKIRKKIIGRTGEKKIIHNTKVENNRLVLDITLYTLTLKLTGS